MTIDEFGKRLTQAESAIYENDDPRTALIYLHKLLDLVESAAFYARHAASNEAQRIALANINHEAHERAGQVLGYIQERVRKEGNT